jgi:phthalate 4,5-cis-dihydrodiol dehydrogenase
VDPDEPRRRRSDSLRVNGSNGRMRLGLAGLGVGSTLFLPGVEDHPHTEIAAAADLRQSALDAFRERYGGRVYASVEALCGDPDVDVIWVTTPNQFHAAHCILAAQHGKHVICTKPMAVTVEECAAMCEAAQRNGVQLLCGQTYSMFPDVAAIRDVVRSGELGKLIAVNSWLSTDWLLKPRAAEELDEALGGGVVYRNGPHLIDTVRLIAGGEVRSVRGSVGRWMPERPCPGNFSAFLDFEDGTPATIAYNGYGYFDTSELTWGIGMRMYSDEERIPVRRLLRSGNVNSANAKEGMRFGAGAQDATSRGSGSHNPAPVGTRAHVGWFGITVASCERGDVRQSPEGVYVYSDDGRREVTVPSGRIGTMEMDELHACLTGGKPIVHDGRWGLATLEVGIAIATSGRERREVMLHHQGPVAR